MKFTTRAATADEQKAIMAVAKVSKYTRDFSNIMFSSKEAYHKGWIRVAVEAGSGRLLGFSCVRHKVREPATSLYFIGVLPEAQGAGVGKKLLQDLVSETPHRCIQLNVMRENESARQFYLKFGFKETGTALKGEGVSMELNW